MLTRSPPRTHCPELERSWSSRTAVMRRRHLGTSTHTSKRQCPRVTGSPGNQPALIQHNVPAPTRLPPEYRNSMAGRCRCGMTQAPDIGRKRCYVLGSKLSATQRWHRRAILFGLRHARSDGFANCRRRSAAGDSRPARITRPHRGVGDYTMLQRQGTSRSRVRCAECMGAAIAAS